MKVTIPLRAGYMGLLDISGGKTTLDPLTITLDQFRALRRPEMTLICDEMFMSLYRETPCKICRRIKYGKIPTVAHHLIAKSTHTHLRFTKENAFPLCVIHHNFAEDKPTEFLEYLELFLPEVREWIRENNHHRNDHKLDLTEVFEQLKQQHEENNNGA